MQPQTASWTLRGMLFLAALTAALGASVSCKNKDAVDPNLGFRLFDTPNTRIIATDPRWRQGEDEVTKYNLDQVRLTYDTLEDVLDIFQGATSSVDIAVNELSSNYMVGLMVGLAGRGVQVRVVTETGQFSSIGGNQSIADILLLSLQQAGIQVRFDGDDTNRAMNSRYAIIDNRIVLTGSADYLSKHFYDTIAGDIKGDINSVIVFSGSRSLAPGGSAAEVNTVVDAFAYDFEEMFIRNHYGNAKALLSKTNFNVGVPVELYFGPKSDVRNALVETLQDANVRTRFAIGQISDPAVRVQLAQAPDVGGVFDGFLSPNGIAGANALPFFYPGFNTMNHQWIAADYPQALQEFQTTIPGRDPVLFVTTCPWTARDLDSSDCVGIRIHDVAAAVRFGLYEFNSVQRATGVDAQGDNTGETVLVFGEVRSATNNAPIEATVTVTTDPLLYLPGSDMPFTADTDPDTGQYAVVVPSGVIKVDVTGVSGPYLMPPTIREPGPRFPGGSSETNFYLSLQPSGSSGT